MEPEYPNDFESIIESAEIDVSNFNNVSEEEKMSSINFLTIEEITDSVGSKQKIESNDSVDSLSNFSDNSTSSLSVLKNRKVELLDSIRSQSSSSTNLSTVLNTPNTSIINSDDFVASIPQQDFTTSAARILEKCRSSFSYYPVDDDNTISNQKFEEAYSDLVNILFSDADILNAYENSLTQCQDNSNKKLEELLSCFPENEAVIEEYNDTIKNLLSEDTNNAVININNNINIVNNLTNSVSECVPNISSNYKLGEVIKSSVKYLNKDESDPDTALIGDDDYVPEIPLDQEDQILKSDNETEADDNEAPAVSKPWSYPEFVSADEEENRDNNDPQWEALKNLSSNYERFMAVRGRWNNIDIPNPNKNLTIRCQNLTMNNEKIVYNHVNYNVNEKIDKSVYNVSTEMNNNRKRPLSPDNDDDNNSKKLRSEACTMLFDRTIYKLYAEVEMEKRQIAVAEEQALKNLHAKQKTIRLNAFNNNVGPAKMKELYEAQREEMNAMILHFETRHENLVTSSRNKIQVLRDCATEVQEFHQFYAAANNEQHGTEGKHSLMFLPEEEKEEILETENMLLNYEKFYNHPRGKPYIINNR